jgi:hypothetical protein
MTESDRTRNTITACLIAFLFHQLSRFQQAQFGAWTSQNPPVLGTLGVRLPAPSPAVSASQRGETRTDMPPRTNHWADDCRGDCSDSLNGMPGRRTSDLLHVKLALLPNRATGCLPSQCLKPRKSRNLSLISPRDSSPREQRQHSEKSVNPRGRTRAGLTWC